MQAALRATRGYLTGRVLLLPGTAPFLLGSSLEADLTLYGPTIEDRHAVIVPEGAGHRLVPVSGKEPLLVGGQQIRQAVPLKPGDAIEVGLHEFVYLDAASGPPASNGARCAACHALLAGGASGTFRLGRETVCSRCVDLRLHVDRGLEGYRVLRKIGQNEEEITYLAVDGNNNARVALRILKAERQAHLKVLRRFLARALVGLVIDHPNFLETRSVRSSRGITFVVLEHIDGTWKLESFVRDQAPVPPEEALGVTNQLAEVLRYARTRQLVVAKRKRSGVLVERRRLWVKVLAYDITRELEAQIAETEAFRDLVARSGYDPAEMAALGWPEPKNESEARLGRLASEVAETFSVGRILYQLLLGKPFQPAVVKEVHAAWNRRRRGLKGESPLEALEPGLLHLLERTLVPQGEDRVKTLQAYTEASKALFQNLGLGTARRRALQQEFESEDLVD